MALTSGTKLGPYEIIAPLGAGGMGEVYTINRVDPQSCYLRVGNRRIDGVPMSLPSGFAPPVCET
jgi:hypothetical protein